MTVAIQLFPSAIISQSLCFWRIEKLIKLKSDTEQVVQELSWLNGYLHVGYPDTAIMRG